MQEKPGNIGDLVDRGEKCNFVGLRRLAEAGNFSDELKRCGVNLVFGNWWFEVEENFDVSAHRLTNLT